MALLTSGDSGRDRDESSTGGPIGALLIAIPLSLLMWGVVVFILLVLVH